ncbi:sensor histidine kinase KdpD [Ramlibacter sp. WS9]|uniref:sensor histidine kinase n=1 Tax=Ramlibacter sp. WS9 TaxID=1882741 RepID=UPI001144AEF4|nr:HAMP domain-containing sensor histidine kinase [Ramlibacter sp. WS9]ROZ79362.1 sensor histidine kinase [Ramlibacter sp. WS9]
MVASPNDDTRIAAATRTLALLNQQADTVRAELAALRVDVARIQHEGSGIPAAQLLEANEQLVLAALRAQSIADSARRRVTELTRGQPPALAATVRAASASASASASGELGQAVYQVRVDDLRDANEQLVIAALSWQELEADAKQAHSKQIKFLAMAAHELRNPLLPLRLAAQMLTSSNADQQVLTRLQATINGQVSHMARLIGDLLDGSRISTGKFRLERAAIDLSGVLELSIETCQPAMDARRHHFRRVGSLGPLIINGDRVRLVQVFTNLLENAAKYTPEDGKIVLDVKVVGDGVTVSITDNGIGISAEALPRVFELFVQDEHAVALNQSGLGIGLAVVRELVEAHGGTVVAESKGLAQGSRFVVTFPLVSGSAA